MSRTIGQAAQFNQNQFDALVPFAFNLCKGQAGWRNPSGF